MVEKEKGGFMGIIKTALSYISQIISASIFPSIAEGADMVMNRVEERMIQYEKRLLKKIFTLLIIGFGAIFLIFALLFFLIEYLEWSKALAFFSIGITFFVIGLLLKLKEAEYK